MAWHIHKTVHKIQLIYRFDTTDICIATATPTGLITPIVRNVEKKGLISINTEIKSLASLAKLGQLTPDQYQGGTFTISNMGMFNVHSFTAIINPPQVAILAVAGLDTKWKLKDEKLMESKTMNVTLSSDHRVVDGAIAAMWLNKFKSLLENPLRFLL